MLRWELFEVRAVMPLHRLGVFLGKIFLSQMGRKLVLIGVLTVITTTATSYLTKSFTMRLVGNYWTSSEL